MSEIADTRPSTGPSRGRTSTRGSRGGYRGSRGAANGTTKDARQPSTDDQGELGELKKKYGNELSTLKDIYPDWNEIDLAFALDEDDGDLTRTINRMAEGWFATFFAL